MLFWVCSLRRDNPELKKASKLDLKVFYYPKFIFQPTINKKRIVVEGCQWNTKAIRMLIHLFNSVKFDFDCLVGANLDGIDRNVRLTNAAIMIIEGYEYLSKPEDTRSKFWHYLRHLSVKIGLVWDHINVFATFEK